MDLGVVKESMCKKELDPTTFQHEGASVEPNKETRDPKPREVTMFRSTPSKTLVVALLILILGTTVTLAQDGTPDAANRLLDAELKELTSGDLDGALEVS